MAKYNLLCRLFGHKPVYVLFQKKVHDGTCKKPHPKYYSPKDYGRGHYVTRSYIKCGRCGQRLNRQEYEK